jgi:hypothetical protein
MSGLSEAGVLKKKNGISLINHKKARDGLNIIKSKTKERKTSLRLVNYEKLGTG